MSSNIVVRHVYRNNVDYEFSLIRQSLPLFPIASIDTEFPGTVFDPEGVPSHLRSTLPPTSIYKVMKKNIDALNLIQLGLTLSDANGNLPTLGTRSQFVWEFNFQDFNYKTDLQNPDSISLLERQGIDFEKNRKEGIDSRYFAHLFKSSVLVPFSGRVSWVTFHGAYDFGFLIKILTQRKLPEDMAGFLFLVRVNFGASVFDVKTMMRDFEMHGGLDQVAGSLKLDRVVGKAHQAGSDSLLILHVFLGLKRREKMNSGMSNTMDRLSLMVYGLTAVN